MDIHPVTPAELDAVRALLCAHGWAHRVADRETFARLVANSQRTAVAVVDGEVVGFVRAGCDGVSNGYLSMLVVAPDHRRRGIGAALVRHIMGDDPRITWVLRAGREAADAFFAKLGFVASRNALERPRLVKSQLGDKMTR
jgi:ribosomal protein S18 acetylase RimI-like enzyme